jgi:sterol desaturase/sphingolipid hydroxylase (fatty acid hydroxylase superfamily)
MKTELLIIAGIYLAFITLEIIFTQFFTKRGQTRDDAVVEVFSTGLLMLVTQPLVVFCGGVIASLMFSDYQGVLENWPFWGVLALFLVFDDMTQYWWHRLSHSVRWLYKLHRPHHNASYLSIRVVYRNNFFYYLLMPGLWFSGMLIYLGGGWVYAYYIVIKMAVICGAHSDVRWDEKLYNVKWLSPVLWVLERLISTPSTHSAHHGKRANDGVTHYKGNYGNLLFLWDVIFGTAKITRRFPDEFGVEGMPSTTVGEQLFWPVIKKRKKQAKALRSVC